ELTKGLVDELASTFQVVAFDLTAHTMAHPKPDTLTPDTLVADLLAIADAAGVERFAYYGYSWLALSGLQLAVRTDRLTALVMGGYPPLDGPYAEMLRVTKATHELAVANATSPPTASTEAAGEPAGETDWSRVQVTLTKAQTRQFVTLYQALQGFDDRAAQGRLRCPRLCFVGSADEITYEERWGGVRVSMADSVIDRRAELEALGWDVEVLEGLDHIQAMQAAQVLPILRPWLTGRLGTNS
ncbi:MAG TPA: alpha/beta hydrolase, partial [Actinomycetes bacterium]|nr:alpha/beta hydrolase [Actinomycetes bacterium]